MEPIDREKVVAEINRVLASYGPNEITSGRYALVSLRDFLDTLEVKEMDLKLNKLYKQGWEDAVAKASIFVYQLATALPDTSYADADKMTDGFKKYMRENYCDYESKNKENR